MLLYRAFTTTTNTFSVVDDTGCYCGEVFKVSLDDGNVGKSQCKII